MLRAHQQLIDQRLPQAALHYSTKPAEEQQPTQQQEHKQPEPGAAAQPASAAAPATRSKNAEEEWTEVVEEKSGQTYYWNEKTGETTELGEPRPKTRFKDQEWEQTARNSGPFQEGWREPPGRDHTYFYSVVGVGIGIAAGWFCQYLH